MSTHMKLQKKKKKSYGRFHYSMTEASSWKQRKLFLSGTMRFQILGEVLYHGKEEQKR